MDMKDLETKREACACELKLTLRKIEHVRKSMLLLEDKLMKQRSEYDSVDRELAMIDGRYHKVGRGLRTKDEDKKIVLTRDQARAIADILGIELTYKGE